MNQFHPNASADAAAKKEKDKNKIFDKVKELTAEAVTVALAQAKQAKNTQQGKGGPPQKREPPADKKKKFADTPCKKGEKCAHFNNPAGNWCWFNHDGHKRKVKVDDDSSDEDNKDDDKVQEKDGDKDVNNYVRSQANVVRLSDPLSLDLW